MKKIIGLLVALLVFSCGKESTKKGNLEITGKVKDLKQGKLYIAQIVDTTVKVIDTIKFDGEDTFETKIEISEPQMLYLVLDRGNTKSVDNQIPFFAEPGKMTIDTKLKEFFNAAKISGSKNHDLYEKFKTYKSVITNEELALTEKEIKIKLQKTNESLEDIEAQRQKLMLRKYLTTTNFAFNHKENEITPYLVLTEMPNATTSILDTINNSLKGKAKNSMYGKKLNELVKELKK
jgi:Domain of unknown function (DUF4369)